MLELSITVVADAASLKVPALTVKVPVKELFGRVKTPAPLCVRPPLPVMPLVVSVTLPMAKISASFVEKANVSWLRPVMVPVIPDTAATAPLVIVRVLPPPEESMVYVAVPVKSREFQVRLVVSVAGDELNAIFAPLVEVVAVYSVLFSGLIPLVPLF